MANMRTKFIGLEKMYLFAYSVFIFTVIGIVTGCDNRGSLEQDISNEFEGKREAVSISLPETPPNWLTIIAVEQGFFSKNGLDVTTKYYPSGKRSLHGMFDGEVDIAATARVPFVFNSFERQDFSIFSAIGYSRNDNQIVARKDSGILKPEDIIGKSLSTQRAAAAHFFLHLFMVQNFILEKVVDISFMNIEKLPVALERGEVDAISTREPFLSEAVNLLGDNAVVLAEPGLFNKTFVLVAFNDYIKSKPHVIHRVIRAMIQSEEYVKKHPEQVVQVLSRKLELSESKIIDILQELKLEVRLDQSLLHGLEDQSRWLVKNKLVDKTTIPYYLDYLYFNALKAVKPERITIIH